MSRRRVVKNLVITFCLVVVFTAGLFVLYKMDAFGAFTASAPFVKGASQSMNDVVVTSEGSTQIGKDGSGAPPCNSIVPTCEGPKGSATNPFVCLEIVANKYDAQMIYLGADDYSDKPMDILKMGIDAGYDYKPGCNVGNTLNLLATSCGFGQWFSNYVYQYHEFNKTDDMTAKTTYVNIGKIYSISYGAEDIKKFGFDAAQFDRDFDGATNDISRLYTKYNPLNPAFMSVDDTSKQVRDIAINDKKNWVISKKDKVIQEGKIEKHSKTGFLYCAAPGEGDFAIASAKDIAAKDGKTIITVTKTNTAADRWIYVENEKDIPEKYVKLHKNDDAKVTSDGWYYKSKSLYWQNLSDLYSMGDGDNLTGLYISLKEADRIEVDVAIEPRIVEPIYSMEYYGLYNNNILKKSLIKFKNQEEYDNFHMKVICVTPSELNEMAKSDDEETVDLIERADLIYIGCYGESEGQTHNIEQVRKMYKNYVDPSYNEKYKTFQEDDLSWELTYKLISRLCNNKNLPLIETQGFGRFLDKGDAEIPMYWNEANPNVKRKATFNNLTKLYILSIMFDFTVRKNDEDSNYKQTFYDDYYSSPGVLQNILRDNSAISNEAPNSATDAGYFNPLNQENLSKNFKLAYQKNGNNVTTVKDAERAYYMWNCRTFLHNYFTKYFTTSEQMQITKKVQEEMVEYGYNLSLLSSEGLTADKLFSEGFQSAHQDGSDGDTGNVAIPHNNGDPGYSGLLGVTEGSPFINKLLYVTYLIMNNFPDDINNQSVKVLRQEKEYTKLTDTSILVDYSTNKESIDYGNKNSFVKVAISTAGNNKDGLVTRVNLVNDEGKTKSVKLYTTQKNDFIDADEYREKSSFNGFSGYTIPADDTIKMYIPYKLKDWQDGYNTIRVTTVGRVYSVKKKKELFGKEKDTDISIDERELFNLE